MQSYLLIYLQIIFGVTSLIQGQSVDPFGGSSVIKESVVHRTIVEEGGTARLTCRISNNAAGTKISWIRSRDLHILSTGQYMFTTNTRFQVEFDSARWSWQLIIRHVQKNDAGSYLCQISARPLRSAEVLLKIVDVAANSRSKQMTSNETAETTTPFAEIMGPRKIRLHTGDTLHLTCRVEYRKVTAPKSTRISLQRTTSLQKVDGDSRTISSSLKVLTWIFNNRTLSSDRSRLSIQVTSQRDYSTESSLQVLEVSGFDAGVYLCVYLHRPRYVNHARAIVSVIDVSEDTNREPVSCSRSIYRHEDMSLVLVISVTLICVLNMSLRVFS